MNAPLPALALISILATSASAANGEKQGAIPSFGDFSLTQRKDPIEITSDKLDFDYKSRRTLFRGNVMVVQGELHLQSDVLTVDYKQVGEKQQLEQVTADGHVTVTQGPKKATGNHAVFSEAERTVVLTGNAVLEEGSNQVNGDKIVVYPDESRMEVIGDNRRVKVILFPGQGGPDGAAPKKKGPGSGRKSEGSSAPEVTPEAESAESAESNGPTQGP